MNITTSPVRVRGSNEVRRSNQLGLSEKLERLTAAYLRGDIDLDTYRSVLKEFNLNIDLRRTATKLEREFSQR